MNAISRLPRLRRAAPAAVLLTGAIALGGCGSSDDSPKKEAAATAPPLQLALADDVPARAAAFAEATIRPTGESKAAIDQVAGLFGVTDPGKAIVKGLDLDEELDNGKNFEKDVLPYLGDHVAAFVLPIAGAAGAGSKQDGNATKKEAAEPDAALVVEVKDASALRSTLEPALRKDTAKVTVDGQQVYRDKADGTSAWFGDKTFALGTEAAVKATIAATKGDTLAGNARFKAAIGEVHSTDPLAAVWVDLLQAEGLDDALASLGGDQASAVGKDLPPAERKQLDRLREQSEMLQGAWAGGSIPKVDVTMAMALEAKPGLVRIKAGGTRPKTADGKPSTAGKESADTLAALPSGSWISLGLSLSDQSFATGADGASPAEALKQLESALGDEFPKDLAEALKKVRTIALSVRGDSLTSIGGAVVLDMQDAAAAGQLVDALSDLAEKQGGMKVTPRKIDGTDRAVVANGGSLPLDIAAGVKGSRVAIGPGITSVSSAFDPKAKLSTDPIYAAAKTALDGDAPALLIDPQPLSQLLASLPLGDDPTVTQVTDVIRRIKLIAGSSVDSGPTTWRSTLAVSFDGRPINDTKPGR